MSQTSRANVWERRPRVSLEKVLDRVAALSIDALRFVPPTRVAETVHRWLEHPNGARNEQDPAQLFAQAMALATDLVLFTPSVSGSTAIDRLARQRRTANAEEAAALDALRQARFRVARVVSRVSPTIVRLQDIASGEMLHAVDEDIPAHPAGLCLALRTGTLGDGRHVLIGAVTPLDEAACDVALGFARPDGKGLANPERCAEAVYRHVLRHGGPAIPGLNVPPEDVGPLDPEECDLADIAQDWARSTADASAPNGTVQRVRDLTCLETVLDALARTVLAREDHRERLAGAYARIAAIQLETIRLRERNGVSGLTLAAVSAAIAHAIARHGMPPGVRALFEELSSGDRPASHRTAGDIDLERLVTRIQALRAKTVAQGCTEQEALAAAEKVAELLDRYGLSLNAVELRQQACHGVAVETGRRRLAPIDDCVPSIAAFFDCRAWAEKSGAAPIRHIFFGLRADVAAAHYLYDLIVLAFTTETDAFVRDAFCAELAGGERRSATHSFQIGLARGIIARLHDLRAAREAALSSSGRDLVPVKSTMVDDELARLGLHFRPGSRASRRSVISDAFAAGHQAGSRFEIRPGLAAGP